MFLFSHKPCLFYNKYLKKSPVFSCFPDLFSVAAKPSDPEIFSIGFQDDRTIFHCIFDLAATVF